ncbi:ribonuclease H1 [Scleropages formosus]|uniref:Ribonuclease H1 n=1 Tax=Scleropages formosus TaxID=113540 RepID=A0A8C9R3B3_SCLFO|nr:ribonuclease H1 [Scleropages formosus]
MLRSFRLYSVARRALCLASGDMAKGKFFYAVRKGSKPGVYRTWDECKVQVLKFPAASYKKFSSEKEAWAFVRGAQEAAGPTASRAAAPAAAGSVGEAGTSSGSSKAVLPAALPVGKRPGGDLAHEVPLKRRKCIQEIPIYTCAAADTRDGFSYMGDAVVVYTDGCCSRNGNRGARAGIGVYWGPDHPLNVAERLQGIQTNQRAELQAACRALELARDMNIKKLVLYTDSMFTINGVTNWIKNWKANGWKLKSGGSVIHKVEFEKLDKLNSELEVIWLHIPGHAGYKGNEEADRLSREGASKPL